MTEEVIITDTTFDTPADNYEEFDQEIDTNKLGARLQQRNTLKGTNRSLQFYAESYLLLELNNKALKSIGNNSKPNAESINYHINLSWISPDPIHHKRIAWKWLYATIACLLLTSLFVYLGTNDTINSLLATISSTVLITAAIILMLIFTYQLQDEYHFKSQYGDVVIFTIENKKPDQVTFDAFFIQLQQAIDKAQRKLGVTERLVGELKMCRRLKDEMILDEEHYTKARTAIFKNQQYKT